MNDLINENTKQVTRRRLLTIVQGDVTSAHILF